MDDLPPDVLTIRMSASGKLLWTSTELCYDTTHCTYYPSVHEYQLPQERSFETLPRSDLTVLDRLGPGVVKAAYTCHASAEEKVVAFKYGPASSYYGGVWDEIQILSRLPSHPYIIPIYSLVVEELSGLGVVGFTMPAIAARTLDKHWPRPFKLRWFRELVGLVDELNLDFGISHQDIAPRNLLINPDTDSILLIDFGHAAQIHQDPDLDLTTEGGYRTVYLPEVDDVKGVMYFLYCVVTRDPKYKFLPLNQVKEEEFEDPKRWVQHPDVELDNDISTFFNEMMAWVRKRRDGRHSGNHAREPRHIEYPDAPLELPVDKVKVISLIDSYMRRQARVEYGRPVLNWQRPPKSKVDKTRRLLATGRYADEEVEKDFILVPDPKRGFPQRPVRVTRSILKRQPFVGRRRREEDVERVGRE
ncbi:hypothetical protein MFIFM68171_08284 [Madurella fahalii]|uniref:EKC/KEOPS complex subunit BUD32 n=1 Tax=Madurella fahalii TaxID=1157608 RepID=A0ABQ0GK54_9PEZI